jgi:hypothetical protein
MVREEWDCLVRRWKEGDARLEMEMSFWVDSFQFSTNYHKNMSVDVSVVI